MLPPEQTSAFFNELEKLAIATTRLRLSQSRAGKRPMSVTTLLRKEKEGTLYKSAAPAHVPFLEGMADLGASPRKKNKGDVPTREDVDALKREDGRGNATTVYGTGIHAPATGGGEKTL